MAAGTTRRPTTGGGRRRRWRASIRGIVGVSVILGAGAAALPAAAAELDLRHEVLDLPGAPAVVLPVDLDGDGRWEVLVGSRVEDGRGRLSVLRSVAGRSRGD